MYRCRPLVMLVLGAGCGRLGFTEVSGDAGDGSRLDASEVAATDAPPSCVDWTARHFDPCALPSPTGGLFLGSGTWTYDTSTGVLTDPSGGTSSPPSLVVASGRVLSVEWLGIVNGGTLRAVGSRPLIIASWDTMDIEGTIDASSSLGSLGAGANPASCNTHTAENGRDEANGSSGGGGGALQGPGGRGGGGSGVVGGLAGSAIAMPLLEGGCPGGVGGRGGAALSVGGRGAGGGAIQLTARTWIALDGTILAGGAGGGGAGDQSGGGGGSGGMIGFEAPMVTIGPTSIIAANGGSGGGGSDSGQRGDDGVTGLPSAQRAAGGRGADMSSGGDGGDGSGGAAMNGTNGVTGDPNAGGGGGGGAGYICIASPSVNTTTAIISPPYVAP